MARSNKPTDKPGYEPVKGHVDPNLVRPKVLSGTHYPHAMGPVCGIKPAPSSAASYSLTDPTCPKCRAWLDAAKGNTARLYPQAAARQADKDARAAEDEPTK